MWEALVLAIALNYLIQKIMCTVLKAQWDGEPGPHSQQQQQQPGKGTVPGKSNLLSLSDKKIPALYHFMWGFKGSKALREVNLHVRMVPDNRL